MKIKSLILAAGKGTRMNSNLPKVIHKVNGVPMVKKILSELKKINIKDNILILGHKKELILEILDDIKYVVQKEQLGTGHAIMQAKEMLRDYDGDIIILCGDTPLLKSETLKKMYEYHKKQKATTTLLTSLYENPFGYGRIIKENEEVIGIVEEKEATEEIKKIREVNAGVYCCDSKELFKALEKVTNDNEKEEYYLTDIIKIQVSDNKKVSSFILEDNEEILGVNSKIDLAKASKILRKRKNEELMNEGVILIDPESTYIEELVKVGKDTVLYPTVFLQGKTEIGKDCKIIGSTRIIDSKLGDNIIIESSVIEESVIEERVTIGPFAHLRPKSHLKKEVHIGNFVEVKKSTLESGVKAGHLTYLGNATIGKDTNIGAGTITCNYDGKNKFDTNIGENVFIGSSTMLVAPLNIGDKALTGAGSVITKDVPANALAVERTKQLTKLKWRK